MTAWRSFPDGAWTTIGTMLSGFGKGEGPYRTAYAINVSDTPFLNGRISASFRLARGPMPAGGIIARADDLRSFVSLYVATDEKRADEFKLRLAVFKHGRIVNIRSLLESFPIPGQEFHLSLQFFSGDLIGRLTTETGAFTLQHVMPERPFPGRCGLIRFYNSSVLVRTISIEEITMRPKLPESEDTDQEREFRVFLTHSTLDKQRVSEVAAQLRAAKITYWIDNERISFGDSIVGKIEDGLQKSKYVVVCLSKNLAKSGWTRAEYGPILYREFSGETTRRVIPLSLDGSKELTSIPILLSDKLRADFTDKADFDRFIEFLRVP